MRRHLWIGAITGLSGLAFSQAQTITLASRNASVPEPFSDLVGLAELRDGRVIVSDRVDRRLYLVDFGTGQRTPIGRNGSGPDEYQLPFGPIRWRGDTLLASDPNNRRFLKIGPNGAILGMIPFAQPREGGITGWAPPRGVDAEGRVYWDAPIVQMQPTVKRLMQANLVRWLPGAGAPEAAMQFADHAQFEHEFRYRPMPQTDAWVVAPDGRIGILSAAEYRLRWYRDGQLVETGPPVPYTPVPVTSAEKEAFWEQRAAMPAAGASTSGGVGPAPLRQSLERVKQQWGDSLFPPRLPPFEVQGALLAPDGNVWVKRNVPARATQRLVDVLDPGGRLRGTLRLPPRTTLFALGSSSVYLISTDDDGLQTLERYAAPAIPR